MPALPDVIRRAMAKRPINRYPSAASMRTALEWIDVVSANRNPQTQDIAPWMETSRIGSVPVAALSSSRPPAHRSSSHPAGKVLSTSGARPIPIAPVVVQELDTSNRQWLQLVLLLTLLGTLIFSGYWYQAQSRPTEPTVPLGLEAETRDAG